METNTELAGYMAFDILRFGYHLPLVDGKPNRELIEDAVTIGIMRNELVPVSQGTVDLAIETVELLLEELNKQ